MSSHTSDSRPNSSGNQIPSKGKFSPYTPRPESSLSSQRRSYTTNPRTSSGCRRPQSTSAGSIRSDGSWMAPEVLAWKRPQRATRVIRHVSSSERQADSYHISNMAHGSFTHDSKRPAQRKSSDCSVDQNRTGPRDLSKRRTAPCDEPRQEVNPEAVEYRARRVLRDVRHQSAPVTLDPHSLPFGQPDQAPTRRRDKLVSLSKDFHNQVVNPMSNRCIQSSEEGMSSSLASKKVVHWLRTSRNRTEHPRSASLTQALRFTALLAQAPLVDAGLDEKIIPSRFNPQNRTTQGSRFVGC